MAQMLKNLPAMQETWVWSLSRKDPLEKEMATHSGVLAWRILWTEEPGGLQSTGSQNWESYTTEHLTHTPVESLYSEENLFCPFQVYCMRFLDSLYSWNIFFQAHTVFHKVVKLEHLDKWTWLFTSSSVQSLSHGRLLAIPWIATHQASLSITNSRSLPKPMPIESVMPSSHLVLCRPLLLLPPIPPSIRVFSNESTLRMRWPKYWSFSFSISPSNDPREPASRSGCWPCPCLCRETLPSALSQKGSLLSHGRWGAALFAPLVWRSFYCLVSQLVCTLSSSKVRNSVMGHVSYPFSLWIFPFREQHLFPFVPSVAYAEFVLLKQYSFPKSNQQRWDTEARLDIKVTFSHEGLWFCIFLSDPKKQDPLDVKIYGVFYDLWSQLTKITPR